MIDLKSEATDFEVEGIDMNSVKYNSWDNLEAQTQEYKHMGVVQIVMRVGGPDEVKF